MGNLGGWGIAGGGGMIGFSWIVQIEKQNQFTALILNEKGPYVHWHPSGRTGSSPLATNQPGVLFRDPASVTVEEEGRTQSAHPLRDGFSPNETDIRARFYTQP
jgi:hypothetical protein